MIRSPCVFKVSISAVTSGLWSFTHSQVMASRSVLDTRGSVYEDKAREVYLHRHQLINAPTAGAQAFLMNHT
jgi:hypothetical protein